MTKKATIKYVTKTTPNLIGEQIARLKQLFPECVSEGRIDFDRLRAALGDTDALAGDDAYAFTWAGKQEAFRAVQTPSAASLAPAPKESVNWEATQHLFIEGENLEVLKLLYKSYYGRVKMIYIDPPYNTGNDFIYRDDYRQPRRAYLEKTGQVDAEGNLLTSNPETSGRYHSDWLTMMYPRLFLARGLLRDDGVIFVSIDDHEVHHLRLLMNEIFGEENFVAQVVWQKVYSPRMDAKGFSGDHDYIIAYCHSEGFAPSRLAFEQNLKQFTELDERTGKRYRPRSLRKEGKNSRRVDRPHLFYSLIAPDGSEVFPIRSDGSEGCWRWSRSKYESAVEEGLIDWVKTDRGWQVYVKQFHDEEATKPPSTVWSHTEVGHNHEAVDELRRLFEELVFPNPKPTRLIKRMLQIATEADGDIVIDFFAGSCTTAQAVLELNREDEGNRRFIMVQLPEPTDNANLPTIADIGKERIRRVIARMQTGQEGQLPLETRQTPADLGFKVFKLAASTFRQWQAPPGESAEALARQLALFDSGLQEDAEPLHVVYEVLLKEGYSLNARVEPLGMETNRIYRVTDVDRIDNPTCFYICLDATIQEATLDGLALDQETTFVCLDTALDDASKANLALQCTLKVI